MKKSKQAKKKYKVYGLKQRSAEGKKNYAGVMFCA